MRNNIRSIPLPLSPVVFRIKEGWHRRGPSEEELGERLLYHLEIVQYCLVVILVVDEVVIAVTVLAVPEQEGIQKYLIYQLGELGLALDPELSGPDTVLRIVANGTAHGHPRRKLTTVLNHTKHL